MTAMYHIMYLIGSNGVVITNSLIFDPSTTEKDVEVEVIEDTMSEKRREFNISIGRIMVVGAPSAKLANSVGEPVSILVYDNDCKYSNSTSPITCSLFTPIQPLLVLSLSLSLSLSDCCSLSFFLVLSWDGF